MLVSFGRSTGGLACLGPKHAQLAARAHERCCGDDDTRSSPDEGSARGITGIGHLFETGGEV
jgi:hypothetical protein